APFIRRTRTFQVNRGNVCITRWMCKTARRAGEPWGAKTGSRKRGDVVQGGRGSPTGSTRGPAMSGTRRNSRAGLPGGLLGMIALVVAVEGFVVSDPLRFVGNPDRLGWRTTRRVAAGGEARRSEVLCFGDSLVKHGVYPTVVESVLGRRAFNL